MTDVILDYFATLELNVMLENQLKELVTSIVAAAAKLKNDFTDEKQAPVNYACIFAQSENEFQSFTKVVVLLSLK